MDSSNARDIRLLTPTPQRIACKRILEIAGDQHGYITTRQAAEAGIPGVELRKLAQRGRLGHPARGVYRMAAFPRRGNDQLMEATLWADARGVISHESALALWELADVSPTRIHVTVPPPYRPRKQGGHSYKIWTRDLPHADIDYIVQQRFIEQAIITARNRQLFGLETEARIRQDLQDRALHQ